MIYYYYGIYCNKIGIIWYKSKNGEYILVSENRWNQELTRNDVSLRLEKQNLEV